MNNFNGIYFKEEGTYTRRPSFRTSLRLFCYLLGQGTRHYCQLVAEVSSSNALCQILLDAALLNIIMSSTIQS
jgi:hypothetical protein